MNAGTPSAFTPQRPQACPLPPAVVAEAADWIVQLQSGTADEADIRACQDWRAADPRHELAWQRLASLDHDLQHRLAADAQTPAAGAALRRGLDEIDRRRSRRKWLGRTLGVAGAGVLGWHLHRHGAWSGLTADLHTATGSRRVLTLDDGTLLHLATASAVDLRFTPQERRIVLHGGEILIATGADPLGRPLRVATADGTVSPLGTRFVVRRHDKLAAAEPTTSVAVLQGRVQIQPRSATGMLTLGTDQQAAFNAQRVVRGPMPSDPGAGVWTEGMLVAERQLLGEFVDELARWRPGVLRCHPSVAALQVTGSFPLADTDQVLAMLARILPLQVVTRTRWWVELRPA
ncbi:FecR domain-containing protein [Verticiella sediminum]|nr:FecR domain-containing protein [Verticiella sediminum]